MGKKFSEKKFVPAELFIIFLQRYSGAVHDTLIMSTLAHGRHFCVSKKRRWRETTPTS